MVTTDQHFLLFQQFFFLQNPYFLGSFEAGDYIVRIDMFILYRWIQFRFGFSRLYEKHCGSCSTARFDSNG